MSEPEEAPAARPIGDRFKSASGLRPASAFVVVGMVLALVAARSAVIALHDPGEQPDNERTIDAGEVAFDLCDANGVTLATSTEYLELVMSPNAMWQAHTPDVMAVELAAVLGEPWTPEEMLERMLPGAENGVLVAKSEPLAGFDAAAAERVRAWLRAGSHDPEAAPVKVEGFGVVSRGDGTFALAWQPAVALSERARLAHGVRRPIDWAKRIATDLAIAVHGAEEAERRFGEDERRALAGTERRQLDTRERLWLALVPSRFKSLVKDVPPSRAQALAELLKREHVQDHQMTLERHRRRDYALELPVFGRWGTLEEHAARKRAEKELGPDASESALAERTASYVYRSRPEAGLELLASDVLRGDVGWIDREGEVYTYLANQAPRRPLSRHFVSLDPGATPPRVITTLEAGVQRRMRQVLESILAEHKPAVVEAIAIDVETGDVLAADALDPYGMGGFLPTMHLFTPGSTFKVPVMASALHEGVIDPTTRFDSQNNHFAIEGRHIGEAEGATSVGIVSATEGLALSVNAVLVQIGTRVAAPVLRDHITSLGYAQPPRAGLGHERSGLLTPLPWKKKYTHASVCFGHEILVTLWQHAAGLATVVRGGHYRPLRLVAAVEQDGRRFDLPLVEDHPLQARDSLSREACDEVRAMMKVGAQIGTGRKLRRDDLEMGTKTGTAEKVPGELCLHVELRHNLEHGCRGSKECRKQLKASAKPVHRRCYTSSICVFGRRVEGGREVMVLLVVDEPRGSKHFGSEVAGPGAMAILCEALGITSAGEPVVVANAAGFHELDGEAPEGRDQPWMEDADAGH